MNDTFRLHDWFHANLSRAIEIRDRILHRQTHPNTIRLFRGMISIWVFFSTLYLLPAAEHFWSLGSYIPLRDPTAFPVWQRALHLLSFESIAPFYPLFLGAQLLFAVLAGLNLWPRLTSAVLYFLTLNLDNRAGVIMDGGNNLMHLILFFLIFMAPATEVEESGSGFKADLKRFGNALSNMAFFMTRIQVAVLYATAGLLKVHGELWPKGVALYYTMNVLEYGNEAVGSLMSNSPLLLAASCFATILFQVSFPILIWPRVTRPILMAVGAVFHISIVFVMGLTSFGLAMCASYFAFYTDRQAARVLDLLWPRERVIAAFDAHCGICRRFARIIAFLDWRGLVAADSAQEPGDARLADVARGRRLQSLQARQGERIFEGYDAIVAILSRVPLFLPIIPLARMIGFTGLGDVLYDQVARRSGWRRQCQMGSCRL